jgi:hypothetical protein
MNAIDMPQRSHAGAAPQVASPKVPARQRCFIYSWAGIIPDGDSVSTRLFERVMCGRAASELASELSPMREKMIANPTLADASGLTPRDIKRLDRFALCAVAGAKLALAPLTFTESERRRLGVIVGTMTAGWTFTEPQLRSLYRSGLNEISPYLASAWFPAAAQGQITIHLGLQGHAKTLATDRCAGSQAIGHAWQRVRSGQERHVLAGAAECPVTPFVIAAYESKFADRDKLLTEGSAFFVLGAQQAHCAPGAAAVEIDGYWTRSLFGAPLQLYEQVAALLEKAHDGKQGGQLSLLVNTLPADAIESEIEKAVDRSAVCSLDRVHFPNRILGDCLAASGPLLAGLAVDYLQAGLAERVLVLSVGHQCIDLLSFISIPRDQHGKESH